VILKGIYLFALKPTLNKLESRLFNIKYKLHGFREPEALILIEIASKLEITFLT